MANGEARKHADWSVAAFLSVVALCVTAICVVGMVTGFWERW